MDEYRILAFHRPRKVFESGGSRMVSAQFFTEMCIAD